MNVWSDSRLGAGINNKKGLTLYNSGIVFNQSIVLLNYPSFVMLFSHQKRRQDNYKTNTSPRQNKNVLLVLHRHSVRQDINTKLSEAL